MQHPAFHGFREIGVGELRRQQEGGDAAGFQRGEAGNQKKRVGIGQFRQPRTDRRGEPRVKTGIEGQVVMADIRRIGDDRIKLSERIRQEGFLLQVGRQPPPGNGKTGVIHIIAAQGNRRPYPCHLLQQDACADGGVEHAFRIMAGNPFRHQRSDRSGGQKLTERLSARAKNA